MFPVLFLYQLHLEITAGYQTDKHIVIQNYIWMGINTRNVLQRTNQRAFNLTKWNAQRHCLQFFNICLLPCWTNPYQSIVKDVFRSFIVSYKASNSSILCLVLPRRICFRVLYLSRPARTFSACSMSYWVFLLSSRANARSELRSCEPDRFSV